MVEPKDVDAVRAALRGIRAGTGLPVAFAGIAEAEGVRLDESVGMRTGALKGLSVRRGMGLGGRVIGTGRPAAVTDYLTSAGITRDYLRPVSTEGLRSMLAMPVVVGGRTRAVLYAADRNAVTFGDQVKSSVARAVRGLADELRIREEVDRRVGYMEAASVEAASGGLGGSDRELLRSLYSDLRVLAGEVADSDLRERLESACGRIARVGRTEGVAPMASGAADGVRPLATREIDVLSQVALGCTNAEAAQRLSLSPETVKAYLRNASQKLGTRTRFEAVTRARSLGLIP